MQQQKSSQERHFSKVKKWSKHILILMLITLLTISAHSFQNGEILVPQSDNVIRSASDPHDSVIYSPRYPTEPTEESYEINFTTSYTVSTTGLTWYNSSAISDMEYSSDGSLIAITENYGTTKVYNATTMSFIGEFGSSNIQSSFSPDSKFLAISDDDQMSIFNTTTWQVITSYTAGSGQQILSSAFSKDGALLATGDEGNYVEVRNTTTWGVEYGAFHSSLSDIYSVSFSPKDNMIAAAGSGGEFIVLNSTNWTVIHQDSGYGWLLRSTFSPDGKLFAMTFFQSVTSYSNVHVFNTTSWNLVKSAYGGHNDNYHAGMQFSADSTTLYMGTSRIYVIHIFSNTAFDSLDLSRPLGSLALHPNGTVLMVGSSTGVMELITITSSIATEEYIDNYIRFDTNQTRYLYLNGFDKIQSLGYNFSIIRDVGGGNSFYFDGYENISPNNYNPKYEIIPPVSTQYDVKIHFNSSDSSVGFSFTLGFYDYQVPDIFPATDTLNTIPNANVTVTWNVTDNNRGFYLIYVNGSLETAEIWTADVINFTSSFTEIATYVILLRVSDSTSNSAFHSVIVSVIDESMTTPSSPNTSSTPGNETISETTSSSSSSETTTSTSSSSSTVMSSDTSETETTDDTTISETDSSSTSETSESETGVTDLGFTNVSFVPIILALGVISINIVRRKNE